jgi:hypothetical protein
MAVPNSANNRRRSTKIQGILETKLNIRENQYTSALFMFFDAGMAPHGDAMRRLVATTLFRAWENTAKENKHKNTKQKKTNARHLFFLQPHGGPGFCVTVVPFGTTWAPFRRRFDSIGDPHRNRENH